MPKAERFSMFEISHRHHLVELRLFDEPSRYPHICQKTVPQNVDGNKAMLTRIEHQVMDRFDFLKTND